MVKCLAEHIKVVNKKEELSHECQECSKVCNQLNQTHFILSSLTIVIPSFIFIEIYLGQWIDQAHASAHGREAVRMWPVLWGNGPF